MEFTDIVPKGVISGRPGEDAVSLLTADHLKVQDLFKQFEELKDLEDGPALRTGDALRTAGAELQRRAALGADHGA